MFDAFGVIVYHNGSILGIVVGGAYGTVGNTKRAISGTGEWGDIQSGYAASGSGVIDIDCPCCVGINFNVGWSGFANGKCGRYG